MDEDNKCNYCSRKDICNVETDCSVNCPLFEYKPVEEK